MIAHRIGVVRRKNAGKFLGHKWSEPVIPATHIPDWKSLSTRSLRKGIFRYFSSIRMASRSRADEGEGFAVSLPEKTFSRTMPGTESAVTTFQRENAGCGTEEMPDSDIRIRSSHLAVLSGRFFARRTAALLQKHESRNAACRVGPRRGVPRVRRLSGGAHDPGERIGKAVFAFLLPAGKGSGTPDRDFARPCGCGGIGL